MKRITKATHGVKKITLPTFDPVTSRTSPKYTACMAMHFHILTSCIFSPNVHYMAITLLFRNRDMEIRALMEVFNSKDSIPQLETVIMSSTIAWGITSTIFL